MDSSGLCLNAPVPSVTFKKVAGTSGNAHSNRPALASIRRTGPQLRSRHRRVVRAAVASGGPVATERAVMEAQRKEHIELRELEKPLGEYMALPASQYSVLDAERIERVDDNTFKCYAHRLSFMSLEVCPVLLVRVDERPNGCCISLLGCDLQGSRIVAQSNDRFSATMTNNVAWSLNPAGPDESRFLESDTQIKVTVDIPPMFRIIPKDVIEGAGSQVLSQLLRVALPRFLAQLQKDYQAWASGDTSRQPLGTGQI